MDFNNRLKREIKRAEEFDTAGLGIISYYLRLYVVEVLLKREDRTAEQTHLASDILDRIESFKQSINELSDDSREKETLFTLVNDDMRAKTYVTNFTMSLYNQQLVRVQKGPWDRDLVGALWCCIDLFNCIIHLWSNDDESRQAITKRIKFCKIYISKIVKGDIGSQDTIVSDENDKEENNIQLHRGGEEEEEEEEEEESKEPTKDLNVTPEDKFVNDNEDSSSIKVDTNEINYSLDTPEQEDTTNVPVDDFASLSLNEQPEPTFVDSDSEIEQNRDEDEERKIKHTTQELNGMMDRSEKIEQAQKYAKYAISALNYEDIGTAKDELTKAMKLLETLL
ncbi:similar to Saccharomyces cerevisiae YLR181C VTA1 Multivesicular body (MVB) protein involved in endosomal protein sorting [Maudiozyma saulgeensis]|uniref:Similar to Saccharomyces cerevisiae YLR181C VTA1 Multivesicular body (MVB) protein involved in endosomal protein sorting n=1 Tax=Maudiozyma saulgeensis TaxID=1789683 RepID=A0A1X7R3B9_9SACH|nr:similar to Saccharomyces cerevisiae YLR181C VTA1 Multivesicular body (MVB) protein involved in endosomal protein sorting [Kazachstania saulgeensis]